MTTWFSYALRLPPELHLKLKAAAAENGRSLNGEIVYRLRSSFEAYRLNRVRP
jgi:predicted HicB family RNase H-like nuclease